MRVPTIVSRRTVTCAAAALVVTVLGAAGVAATAAPTAAAAPSATALPAHVYAPYFEAWTTDSISTIASESGVKYMTLAFLQAPKAGSCADDWNGDTTEPVSGGMFLSQIAALRATGGDVIPSFGGYTADSTGTELADSCTSVK